MNTVESTRLSVRAAPNRIRLAGVILLVLSLLAPWFRAPLSAWLVAGSAAGLILGVMILKRSYVATALAVPIPVILVASVLLPRDPALSVWFVVVTSIVGITVLLLIRDAWRAQFSLPTEERCNRFSRVTWLICCVP